MRDACDATQSRSLDRARKFAAIARELGVSPAPLAIAWFLRNPHVSMVILGASRVEQLHQNLDALDLAHELDNSIWARLEAATG